jgi:ATP-dependent Clp protease protease subunit
MSTNEQAYPWAPAYNSTAPMVVVKGADGSERGMDAYAWLLQEGLIDLTGPIDSETYKAISAQFAYLNHKKFAGERRLFLNTPGGSVLDGLAIYDKVQREKKLHDVATICNGMAASMGSVLLCCGTKGMRGINRHGKVMIHQARMTMGGTQTTVDMSILAEELEKSTKTLAEKIALHTGKSYEEVREDMKKDTWLSAEEALNYGPLGLVDKILD